MLNEYCNLPQSDCGTSRNTLEMIRASGIEPTIVEYLQEGWTRPQLLGLFSAAGLTPRDALRVSKSPAEEMGLTDPMVSDEKLLDAMTEYPVLVNRPIVCSPRGERLCRPSEMVLDLIESQNIDTYIKEDGEIVNKAV